MIRSIVWLVLLAGCAEEAVVDESSPAFGAELALLYRDCTVNIEARWAGTTPGESDPLTWGSRVYDAQGLLIETVTESPSAKSATLVERDEWGREIRVEEILDDSVREVLEFTYHGDTVLVATLEQDSDGDGEVDWALERAPLAADGTTTATWYDRVDGELVVSELGEELYVTPRRRASVRRVRASDGAVTLRLSGTWTEVDEGFRYDVVGPYRSGRDGVWTNTFDRWLRPTSETQTQDGWVRRERWSWHDEHYAVTRYVYEAGEEGSTLGTIERETFELDENGRAIEVRRKLPPDDWGRDELVFTYTWDCP